ncbi:uncharacterized protein LOC118649697 [Myotis myotis]|uniref:uncharacterized protein LOC118649697 n=1 Tax=Myotis myotis TaxID=51298 RepID=UPI001748A5F8|nr:uncharacterized protein LOC118649697 [Myotis myotis]
MNLPRPRPRYHGQGHTMPTCVLMPAWQSAEADGCFTRGCLGSLPTQPCPSFPTPRRLPDFLSNRSSRERKLSSKRLFSTPPPSSLPPSRTTATAQPWGPPRLHEGLPDKCTQQPLPANPGAGVLIGSPPPTLQGLMITADNNGHSALQPGRRALPDTKGPGVLPGRSFPHTPHVMSVLCWSCFLPPGMPFLSLRTSAGSFCKPLYSDQSSCESWQHMASPAFCGVFAALGRVHSGYTLSTKMFHLGPGSRKRTLSKSETG